MRSWIPRTPSSRIERQLFGPRREECRDYLGRLLWRGLAPATVICVLALALLPLRPEAAQGGVKPGGAAMELALSNSPATTWNQAVNIVGVVSGSTLESTNPLSSLSTIDFILRSQATNRVF